MPFDQFGIHLGPLYLRYYGIILVTGAFLGAWLAAYQIKRKGQNPDLVWDGLIWALIGGVVGARLWHVLTPPPSMVALGYDTVYYFTHPIEILMVWNGGLGIPGAVMGGVLGLYFYTRYAKLNFPEWLDLVAPSVALGQAIGRWGNFVNQELYGAPTTLPWGIQIDHPLAPYTPEQRFHPLFLYESIGNALICGGLLYLARRFAGRLKTGDLFLLYLIFYPVLRFVLEFIRLDSSQVLSLNANQTLMAMVAVAAGGFLFARHRRARRYQ
jgi:phosphatidylglycerol:prolipoprotein diacylglycerol transferase